MATKMENFSPELPMELVTEVLARLPVKSLMRFRCVCKEWCSLISSSDFASLHLSCFHKNGDKTAFLCKIVPPPRSTPSNAIQWTIASCMTYERITQDERSILISQPMVDHSDYGHSPCGSSVDGIVLLAKSVLKPGERQVRRELMLWNPMIRKTHNITPYFGGGCLRFGLGYSRRTNDYKVVAVPRDGSNSAQVYSLNSGTWRNIFEYRESIHHVVMCDGSSLVQGTIAFISENFVEQSNSHMVLFDVDDEVFKYVELPSELGVEGHWKYPVVYHGKIGLLNAPRHDEDEESTLWVMGDDQVPGSWTKLYALRLQKISSPSSLLFFKNNGEFMLIHYGQAGVYDVESGEMKLLTGDFSHLREYCTPYKESLMLL